MFFAAPASTGSAWDGPPGGCVSSPHVAIVPHVSFGHPDDRTRCGMGLLGGGIRALAEGWPLRELTDEARGYWPTPRRRS